jgi:hypothetical protein
LGWYFIFRENTPEPFFPVYECEERGDLTLEELKQFDGKTTKTILISIENKM